MQPAIVASIQPARAVVWSAGTPNASNTGAVGHGLGELLLEERLPLFGGLPDLGEVVPLEVVGTEGRRVGHPRADELRASAHDPHHKPATPVVADQVDGSVVLQPFELSDEPGHVLLLGRPEPDGAITAEPGKLEGLHIGRPQMADQRVPDCRGLGNAMDENGGHWRSLPPASRARHPLEGGSPRGQMPLCECGVYEEGADRTNGWAPTRCS